MPVLEVVEGCSDIVVSPTTKANPLVANETNAVTYYLRVTVLHHFAVVDYRDDLCLDFVLNPRDFGVLENKTSQRLNIFIFLENRYVRIVIFFWRFGVPHSGILDPNLRRLARNPLPQQVSRLCLEPVSLCLWSQGPRCGQQ